MNRYFCVFCVYYDHDSGEGQFENSPSLILAIVNMIVVVFSFAFLLLYDELPLRSVCFNFQ